MRLYEFFRIFRWMMYMQRGHRSRRMKVYKAVSGQKYVNMRLRVWYDRRGKVKKARVIL